MTRARRTSALLVGAVLAVAACGGGDEGAAPRPSPAATAPAVPVLTDDAAIADLARYVARDEAAATICKEKFSAKLVSTAFHTVSRCKKALKSEAAAESPSRVAVSDLRVTGLAGTATVTEQYGEDRTVRGTWAFLRAGDQWRVAAWGVDYLRSSFTTAFGARYEPEGPHDLLADPAARDCLSKRVQDRSDAAFTRLAHGVLSRDKAVLAQVQEYLIACSAVRDASGTSALRRLFEAGLQGRPDRDTRPEIAACLLRTTRSVITDQHLADVERARKSAQWLDRRVKNAGLDCALAEV